MPRKEKVQRSVNWCFTLNNPTQAHKNWFVEQKNESLMKFLIVQEELSSTGTTHLQGYFVLNKRMELPALKKKIPGNPHLEVRKGTHEQAKAYCEKQDTRVEGGFQCTHGEVVRDPNNNQGQRTDLEGVRESIESGATEMELWENHFTEMVKYRSSLNYYAMLKNPRRQKKTFVNVFFGPTGTGKSMTAFENAGDDYYNLTPGQTPKNGQLFFEGYRGQKNVIFDEFYGSSMSWSQLLALTDRYPAVVMVKGSSVNFNPETIWITSNQAPWQWYNYDHKMKYETFERRIDNLVEFTSLTERVQWKKPQPPTLISEEDYLKKFESQEIILQDGIIEQQPIPEQPLDSGMSQIDEVDSFVADIFGGNRS